MGGPFYPASAAPTGVIEYQEKEGEGLPVSIWRLRINFKQELASPAYLVQALT